ncbi:MAG: Maf family protein [Kiritimatiellae bacterium]|jgi:septum formation protein|nr:Maf family protein [Kiritimatiellia bacterium]
MKLILASESPRREKLLKELCTKFCIYNPMVEEVCLPNSPEKTARQNAILKVKATIKKYPSCHIIAADTVISFHGKVIGKPNNSDEAYKILERFSGRKHQVITAVAIYSPINQSTTIDVCKTNVFFKHLSHEEIAEYHKLVSPIDKAGGYNIDEHANLIIKKIDGSKTNVMGLPIDIICKRLKNVNC